MDIWGCYMGCWCSGCWVGKEVGCYVGRGCGGNEVAVFENLMNGFDTYFFWRFEIDLTKSRENIINHNKENLWVKEEKICKNFNKYIKM